jgi:hypothetical protein
MLQKLSTVHRFLEKARKAQQPIQQAIVSFTRLRSRTLYALALRNFVGVFDVAKILVIYR